jgi:hypothetical protein
VPPQGEALAVWALLALDVVLVFVTYSVLEPAETYNVSRDGLAGGASRALVQLNFPVALFAIPLTLLALAALPRRAWTIGAPAIGLCVLVPFVVDPGDLDARPQNVLPALGVGLALALTTTAARLAGTAFEPWLSSDSLRVTAAIVVILVSLPWFTAEAGFHFPGDVFLGEEPFSEPGNPLAASVHLGHHHGFAGTLFVLGALLLSRVRLRTGGVQRAYAALLSLMLVYGAVNVVEDGWYEQVVKRGWTSADIPSALMPGANVIWGLIVVTAATVYGLGFARPGQPAEPAIIT